MRLYGYSVNINQTCNHSESSDEEFGWWTSSFTNEAPTNIEKVSEFPDVISSLNIPVGTDCYIVWAEWSTGDSFGNAEHAATETMGIFQDSDCAESFSNYLYRINEDQLIDYETEDGQIFNHETGYNKIPWYGHFENLSDVCVSKVHIIKSE